LYIDANTTKIKLNELIQTISGLEFNNSISTRAANRKILDCLKENSFGVIGGSADLTESNSMSLERIFSDSLELDSPGDNISFGVREHAMSALINGLAVESNSIPYCATYLAFSDFQKPAIRMAALMKLFVTYMWTHDSLVIGADGPTHQPIEQLAMLRSTPNFSVVRPADGRELQVSWSNILKRQQPTGLVLSRQNLPILDLEPRQFLDAAKGAYVVRHSHDVDKPDVIIIATGSEVHLAVAVQEQLNSPSVGIRVVSMPCMEWFRDQEEEYRNSILPPQVKKRIIVEAASRFGWAEFVGLDGRYLTADTFGESGDGEMLMSRFGFTEENLKSVVLDLLENTNS
jgi:transketolase